MGAKRGTDDFDEVERLADLCVGRTKMEEVKECKLSISVSVGCQFRPETTDEDL